MLINSLILEAKEKSIVEAALAEAKEKALQKAQDDKDKQSGTLDKYNERREWY